MRKPRAYWWLYRVVMKLAHRCDWHYAPVIGPLPPDGAYQRWCQWCGFRESFRKDAPGMKRTDGTGEPSRSAARSAR